MAYGLLKMTAVIVIWAVLLLMHLLREFKAHMHSGEKGLASSKDGMIADSRHLGGDVDGLFWFVQVSDIHINDFGKGNGVKHFEFFLRETLPVVNPSFVIATGDLTDAKVSPGLKSYQVIEEWKTYNSLLAKAGILDKDNYWFDLRGNHDCFDVPGWKSPQNLFATYSRTKVQSFEHVFEFPFGKYALISVDGCPEHGPSRAFNFFGTLTQSKMDLLEEQLQKVKSLGAKHTFIASHYPLVTMQFAETSNGKTFYQLTQHVTAYFSGHLHRFIKNAGRELFARKSTGMLDLEVNDLKDHQMFRIAAIDNDIFSFVDVEIDQFPFILPTNPKDARFIVPHIEDTMAASMSSHIRVLIFGKSEITDAYAIIDNTKTFKLKRVVKDGNQKYPLFVSKWNPNEFATGTHIIAVFAKDASGKKNSVESKFRIDGKPIPIESVGSKLMYLPLQKSVKLLFWSSYLFSLMIFLIPLSFKMYLSRKGCWRSQRSAWIESHQRLCRQSNYQGGSRIFWSVKMLIMKILLAFLCLLENNAIFWPNFLLILTLPIVPLLITPLCPSSNTIWFLFVWGIWSAEHGWTYLFDTWTYTTATLIFQIIPALFIISQLNFARLTGRLSLSFCLRICRRICIAVWLILCGFKNVMILRVYGTFPLVFGSLPTWHFVFSLVTIVYLSWKGRWDVMRVAAAVEGHLGDGSESIKATSTGALKKPEK